MGPIARTSRHGSRLGGRRGFTLAELLMAAVLSSLVAVAGMSMVYAGTHSWMLTDDTTLAARRGQALLQRIGRTIRAARSASVNSATQLSIWAADSSPASGTGGVAGNDAVELCEIRQLDYSSSTKKVVCTWEDVSGSGSLNVSLGIPGVVTIDVGTYAANGAYSATTRTETWAEDVASLVFSSHSNTSGVNIISVTVTVGSGNASQSFSEAFSPRGPGFYVSNANGTMEGTTGIRKRNGTIATWQ